jgi:UDP-2-acetamido-2-deoxy-ribo-hexuluronate aminotransferase
MEAIRMVDLRRQYERFRDEINGAIQQVLDATAFINGPDVKAFVEEFSGYLDIPHAVPCGNGTDALQVALMALDLQPGDEVITTPFSFIASIEVIRLLKLVPVLADVNPHTFNIDPGGMAARITPRTKAVIPVHLFGQCAFMEGIMEPARSHGLSVIEDAAQAVGAEYIYQDGSRKRAGTIGDIGTASFFPSKNLGCYGDGGAIMTRDAALYKKMRAIVNHGSLTKYYHDEVGVNSRLDTLQAAILRVKLRHLDSFHLARQKVAEAYDSGLGDIPQLDLPARVPYSTHIFHQYTIILRESDRDQLRDYLAGKDIPVMVYYPLPLHLQRAYRDLGYRQGDFPVTEALSRRVLSLPMHTEMESGQIEYICHHIRQYLTGRP